MSREKSARFGLRLAGRASLLALTAALAASAAQAQDAETPTVLEKIVVSSAGKGPRAAAEGRARDNDTIAPETSDSVLKDSAPLSRTPRSVAVITRKELDERAVNDMIDAVNYAAGVQTGQYGFDPRFDQISIRGYATVTTGDFRDGLRQPYMNYGTFRTDVYGLERVEVIKGPVSVLYGGSSVAGIVNRVSKMADGLQHGEVETQWGSYGRAQLALDYGDVSQSNDAFSWRVVGVARRGDTSYDIADNRLMLAPSFQWAPDDATSLTVYAIGQKDETDTNVQGFDYGGEILRYSDPDYDYQKVSQLQTGYMFEHEFDNGVKFSQHVRYSVMDLDSRYLEVSATDEATGVMSRYPVGVSDHMNVYQADNRLSGAVDTGPLEHKLTAGLDATWINSSFGLGYGVVSPDFDLDLDKPSTGVSGPTPELTSLTGSDQRQIGVYAQDQITFGGWTAVLGLRNDWIKQTTWDDAAGVETGEGSDSALSYQAGLLYRFDSGLAPYVSYATSFVPQSYRDEGGALLTPMTGEQFEAGVKFRPDGADYAVNLAYYHMVQSDAATYAGSNDTVGYYYRALGEVTSNGVEIEARKAFSNGFDLIAGYNYNAAEITESTNPAEVGNRPSTTPLHSASLWGNYTVQEGGFMDGLSGGLGLRYAGKSFKDTTNTTENEDRIYLDAALNFDIGKQFRRADGLKASISVKNVFDKRDEVCTDGYCYFAQGRTVLGSLKYSW
ncbi:TonB-dependent siderophore receptor [Rhizobium sp. G21]|uniref:TonB-dependent siderophore receptor n=1 Tax=Rhizobium sp. G21 TaxID=2758439 RepID=UPI001600D634|nr:TonB-dependent siderophore receptor [Rhizobium sp. G21]MBB1248026.1 TonB-dependent siderophore receptor [Rhizobium sp. G21]